MSSVLGSVLLVQGVLVFAQGEEKKKNSETADWFWQPYQQSIFSHYILVRTIIAEIKLFCGRIPLLFKSGRIRKGKEDIFFLLESLIFLFLLFLHAFPAVLFDCKRKNINRKRQQVHKKVRNKKKPHQQRIVKKEKKKGKKSEVLASESLPKLYPLLAWTKSETSLDWQHRLAWD